MRSLPPAPQLRGVGISCIASSVYVARPTRSNAAPPSVVADARRPTQSRSISTCAQAETVAREPESPAFTAVDRHGSVRCAPSARPPNGPSA